MTTNDSDVQNQIIRYIRYLNQLKEYKFEGFILDESKIFFLRLSMNVNFFKNLFESLESIISSSNLN